MQQLEVKSCHGLFAVAASVHVLSAGLYGLLTLAEAPAIAANTVDLLRPSWRACKPPDSALLVAMPACTFCT